MTPLIRRGLIAEASERPADSPQTSAIAVRGARRRLILFAGIGIAAYALAMVATIPASAVLKNRPWRSGIAGTVWNGEVGVGGASRIEWSWSPLRSLTSLGFAADWRASGATSDLGGRALLRSGSVALDNVSGTLDGALLAAIKPDLPFTCDLTMQADLPRVVLGGNDQAAIGRIVTDVGTCTPKAGGSATGVGPLLLTAEKIGAVSHLRLVPATQRRRTLMTFALAENGTVDIAITPEGAASLPFVGLPSGASIRAEM